MNSTPPLNIDQPNWHPAWKRYVQVDGQTVVLHNYGTGVMWYVCTGSQEYPCVHTALAVADQDAAEAMFDTIEARLRGLF